MTGKCLKCLVQQYRSFKFKHFCPLSPHYGKEGLRVTLKRVILDTIGISQKFLDTSLVWQSFLTHFMPLISFDTPWKHQKARNFLMFSGGIKEVSGMKWFNASAYKICLCSGLAKSFLKTLLKSLLLFRLLRLFQFTLPTINHFIDKRKTFSHDYCSINDDYSAPKDFILGIVAKFHF